MQQLLPKSISKIIEPLAGEIDQRIADLVSAMREQGFSTVSSCEGHFRPNDFKHVKPNVVFCVLDRGLLHSWIREVSKTKGSDDVLSCGFLMFPVWNPETDVVHEDNWILEIDVSDCKTSEEAGRRRNETVLHLIATLQAAIRCRPLATDTFVRSRW
jgi:hypothetical protein